MGVAIAMAPATSSAQQPAASAAVASQLPPAAQRPGNLPLRNVPCSYTPCGKRVSPQDGAVWQVKPNGQTPRDAQGHPDLSGNWGAANLQYGFPGGGRIRRNGSFEADQSAMQRGAQWNKPIYKPEYWEKVRSLDYGKADVDPAYGCYKPVGVPRQNVPGRIVMKDNQLWLLNSVENGLRILPLNNAKRDEEDYQFSTYNGMGLAHWDGDTLVVETTNMFDRNGIGGNGGGQPFTDALKITERLTRVDANTIEYKATIDDPKTYTRPFTLEFPWRRDNSYGMFEYACHEGNHSLFNILSGARADDREAAAASGVRP
jgi:hypothetical protein